MLGKIIAIEDNFVIVDLKIDIEKSNNIINKYALLKSNKINIVGEILNIKENNAYINILGEIINDQFVFGIMRKPSFSSEVTLLDEDFVSKVISTNLDEKNELYLGMSPVYEDTKIKVKIDDFFSAHFAIFGSTGSGKSCSVARIFQNLFEKENSIPYRATIFIFDAYGEYHSAFKDLNKKVKEINFKTYTTDLGMSESELLRIPLWLLGVDDICILLDVEKSSQINIIEKALEYVTIFARDGEEVMKSKNDIISRALLDILMSGKSPSQIRDQIVSILSYFNTKDLNLDTEIYQPGYSRPLKQCFIIDASGKLRETEMLMNFFQKFMLEDNALSLPDGSFMYTLNDLKDALDFALISEGVLNSDKVYEELNILKVRLHSLVNSAYKEYFSYPKFVDIHTYIKELITANNGMKAQIINFNINYIDDRLAKDITKIYSKMIFDYAKNMEKRGSIPFHIVLEEAHRYVQNDQDKDLLGYNIFERITKEGRKYGVILGLISQRPSELSDTTLSQCNNFLIFKMLHPIDVGYIKDMVPNITIETVKRLRILQPGTCIGFGSAFKIPLIIKFDMPSPSPESSNCEISKIWFIDKK